MAKFKIGPIVVGSCGHEFVQVVGERESKLCPECRDEITEKFIKTTRKQKSADDEVKQKRTRKGINTKRNNNKYQEVI